MNGEHMGDGYADDDHAGTHAHVWTHDTVGMHGTVETHGRASLRRDNQCGNHANVYQKFNKNNPLWQANYHDHIIRNEMEYRRIAEYIVNNPLKWNEDTLSNVVLSNV